MGMASWYSGDLGFLNPPETPKHQTCHSSRAAQRCGGGAISGWQVSPHPQGIPPGLGHGASAQACELSVLKFTLPVSTYRPRAPPAFQLLRPNLGALLSLTPTPNPLANPGGLLSYYIQT